MKYIRAGSKVSTKLTLPKDLIFQILGAVLDDLSGNDGFAPLGADLPPEVQVLLTELRKGIRHRDIEATLTVVKRFSPRRIMEMIGTSKDKAGIFFALYQLGSLVKKYPFSKKAARAAALDKFHLLENRCKLYNDENHRALLVLSDAHPDYRGVLDELRYEILSLIGTSPPDSIFDQGRHGPGASTDVCSKLGEVTAFFKYATLPYGVTMDARNLAIGAIQADQRWMGALDEWYRTKTNNLYGPIDLQDFWSCILKISHHSRITTVPKSYETDRTIAIEPRLNVYLQLGVDGFIRRRLKTCWNYNLDDQEPNQDAAYLGSLLGEIATLDLEGASDTVTLKICELLLPPLWLDLLLSLRCHVGVYKERIGKVTVERPVEFQKISSMGNGYTFALESLIFGAITRVACRRSGVKGKSYVYGDDIAVPKDAYHLLCELLQLCGFSLNKEKSFSEGPFRESCGKDYFHGVAVRPIFITRPIKNLPDLFYVHNSFYQLERSLHWTFGVSFSRVLSLIKRFIPPVIRAQFYGPPGENLDTYLFSTKKLGSGTVGSSDVRYRYHFSLVPQAVKFNRLGNYRNFHFRKLMASLRPSNSPPNYLQKGRTLPAIGNAFDITKRSRTTLKCVRSWQPQGFSVNPASSCPPSVRK